MAFPRNAQGQLLDPAAVAAEGKRINDSLAAGTYGEQPIQARNAAVGNPGIVVAPASARPLGPEGDLFDPARRYGNSFFGPFGVNTQDVWNQNPAEIRNNLQLDVLRNTATERRLALENEVANAPLQTQLLQARIAAEGAHERHVTAHDTEALQHTTGFFNALNAPGAPRPHEPGYRELVLGALTRNPAFARTPGGAAYLKDMATGADTHDSIAGIAPQAPPGTALASVTTGGKTPRYTYKPTPNEDIALAKDAKSLGLTLDQVRNPVGAQVGRIDPTTKQFVGDETGDVVQIPGSKGLKVKMSTKAYERLGGTYGGARSGVSGSAAATPTARAADITEADYAKLKSGDPYQFGGRTLRKQ